jgi:hypothetical protein
VFILCFQAPVRGDTYANGPEPALDSLNGTQAMENRQASATQPRESSIVAKMATGYRNANRQSASKLMTLTPKGIRDA